MTTRLFQAVRIQRIQNEIEFAHTRLIGIFLKLKEDDVPDLDRLGNEVYSVSRQLQSVLSDLNARP